ncbi:hypothetical protein F3Y22_tig00112127pilonHSYRG00080 [Hibiscus syriacus]|uniref:Protein kinase domain-containing protein n=1 Tax=Hibiscus syriacus TaxID=106335 RepID=A0A6A2X5Q0_HIBSY|nr:hypothetical protein F3Y22_tig00112127pilonHSYRG00080 [Hibiscus syriacus]
MVSSHRPLLRLPWIILALFLSLATGDPKPGCQRSCGNFSIDYPFGISEGCFMHDFEITCNASYNSPKPFLRLGADLHEVVDISVACNQVRVRNSMFCGTGYGTPVSSDVNITTGCFSVCNDKYQDVTSGPCSGLGCYQDSIPEGTTTIHVDIIENLLNDSKINDLYNVSTANDNCGMLSWWTKRATANENSEAVGTSCKGMNIDCVRYESGSTSRGYRCRCKHGYTGNPYLSSGCPDKQHIAQGNGTCTNLLGSYSCSFPLPVVLGSGEPPKIFTIQELAEAIDNYAESRVVGRGGSGTVYKGTLCNGRVIPVKKSRMVNRNRINEFINEVVVFTKINHHNVVKLLGYCLETEDDNYTAKVADFGASRSIPADQSQITTLVKGTLRYLDPEYFQTSRLTEKSDVYSFGVVLVELLTGQLPVSSQRPEAQIIYLLTSFKQCNRVVLSNPGARLANEGNIEQLEAIADLGMRCLWLKGEEQPTMKEVVLELAGSRQIYKYPWHQVNREETHFLFDKQDLHSSESSSALNLYSDMSLRQYSVTSLGTFSMDLPR